VKPNPEREEIRLGVHSFLKLPVQIWQSRKGKEKRLVVVDKGSA
jgi:hypothetical protein